MVPGFPKPDHHRSFQTVRGVTLQATQARRLVAAFAPLAARVGRTSLPAIGRDPLDAAAHRLTRLPDRL